MKPKKKPVQKLIPFIKGILRNASFRWKPRNEALVAARVSRGRYKCASCSDLFGPKEIQVDHIYPVVDPKVGFTNFDDYITRLFCPADHFQILCSQCHSNKTQREDHMREFYKNELDKQAKEE